MLNDLAGIRLFLLASENTSFASAARRAGISSAAMTRQIQGLERVLGVRLFNRGTRTLSLTEAGHELKLNLGPVLETLDASISHVSNFQLEARGLLRVAVRGLIASQRIIPLLGEFLNQHPQIEIEILVSTSENVELLSENIDVDIRFNAPDSTDVIARRLGSPTKLILVCAPSYLHRFQAPRTVRDLEGHSAILYSHAKYEDRWDFLRPDGALCQFTPSGKLRVNDGSAYRSALLEGIGLGLAPLAEIATDLSQGNLIQLLPDHEVAFPTIGNDGMFAVYQRSKYQPMKLRLFLNYIEKRMEK